MRQLTCVSVLSTDSSRPAEREAADDLRPVAESSRFDLLPLITPNG